MTLKQFCRLYGRTFPAAAAPERLAVGVFGLMSAASDVSGYSGGGASNLVDFEQFLLSLCAPPTG